MAWTDKMVADLRKMWAEGSTTGEIAKKLSVSKNSIVGKVHRLGLSGRPSPIKKKIDDKTDVTVEVKSPKKEKIIEKEKDLDKKTTDTKPASAPKKEKSPKEASVKESSPAKTPVAVKEIPIKETIKETKKEETSKSKDGVVKLVDLDTHTCRWPIGDPKDEKFHFCGKKVRLGQTYCDEHSETAYVKQTKR